MKARCRETKCFSVKGGWATKRIISYLSAKCSPPRVQGEPTFSLSQINNVELARTLSWRENALLEERKTTYFFLDVRVTSRPLSWGQSRAWLSCPSWHGSRPMPCCGQQNGNKVQHGALQTRTLSLTQTRNAEPTWALIWQDTVILGEREAKKNGYYHQPIPYM